MIGSLNPYSNGLPSRGAENSNSKLQPVGVLIPILMDYPLGVVVSTLVKNIIAGLNPYSNGLPSRG